jgi:tripartite-type tricarboxylate transporter receptor subunit TctC
VLTYSNLRFDPRRDLVPITEIAVLRVLALPEVHTRPTELGLDSIGTSPREMAAYLQRQFEFWAPVVEAPGCG